METCKESNGDSWEIYKTDDWRWRQKSRNGQIIGASTESYKNKADCIANARRNGMTCTPA